MEAKYYNTTNQTGDALKRELENTSTQEGIILQVFKKYPGKSFRTCDIELLTRLNHDSVKRAITVLTVKGELYKSEKADTPGRFLKPVHTWSLAIKAVA